MLQLVPEFLVLTKSAEADVDGCCRTGVNFGLGHVGVTDMDMTFDFAELVTVSG
jgi:hypothetical protein